MAPYAIFITGISTVMVMVRLTLRLRNEGGGLGIDDVRAKAIDFDAGTDD